MASDSSNGTLHIRSSGGKTLVQREGIHESQGHALAVVAEAIREHIHGSPVVVGHRVVHGGPNLLAHQPITPQVVEELRAATHFAPVHIPQALSLIASAQSIFPSATQFACFDDVFHRTMPEVASHLPLPQRYFDAGVRRYGFHGLSYESLVHHFGSQLPGRAIFAHLGNGASLCALRNGVSIDTTMGLTPTGGIPMGTRSGDLDPGVILYLLRAEKLDADKVEELINHQSGLFALSCGVSDVKTLEERSRCQRSKSHACAECLCRLRAQGNRRIHVRCSVVWTFSSSLAASASTVITFVPQLQMASNLSASPRTRLRLSPHRKNNRSRVTAGE